MRGHHRGLDYHATLLGDPLRIDAYDRALRAIIRPGDVVLDIGTGTGILAMLAARHGAARVHAVEVTEVAELARELVAHNGLSDRVQVHRADLVEMAPIEPVDVVLGEWLGRFVVDDEMLDAVDAARGWARDEARWCPGQVDLYLGLMAASVPTTSRFAVPLRGLDLSPALPAARTHPARVRLSEAALAAPAMRAHTLVPGDLALPPIQASYLITKPTALFAIAGWWEAELAPRVRLSTAPGQPTHWDQIAWPTPPTPLQPGDLVHVSVHAEGRAWVWSARVLRGGQTVLDHHASSDGGSAIGPGLAIHPDAAMLGRQALAAGDLNAAIAHLGAAICAHEAGDEASSELHALHGQALARAGLLQPAMDALLAAEAGGHPEAPRWLGAVAWRLGWAEIAEHWRRECLRRSGPWTDPLA